MMSHYRGQRYQLQHGMLLALLGSCLLHLPLIGNWHQAESGTESSQLTQSLHVALSRGGVDRPELSPPVHPEEEIPLKPTPRVTQAAERKVHSKPAAPAVKQTLPRVAAQEPVKTQPARLWEITHDQPVEPKASAPLKSLATTTPVAENPPSFTRQTEAATISTASVQKSDDNLLARNETRRRIKLWLEQQVANSFRYPGKAKRRNWEGTVMLSLVVEKDGRIEGIEIVDSSGHGILDRDALETLKQIKQVRLEAPLLLSQAMELTMPVIYRLDRG
ncbi:MAG: energy transducer TonB [Candidatus Sedimenticola sp. 20ELBAFRAG]